MRYMLAVLALVVSFVSINAFAQSAVPAASAASVAPAPVAPAPAPAVAPALAPTPAPAVTSASAGKATTVIEACVPAPCVPDKKAKQEQAKKGKDKEAKPPVVKVAEPVVPALAVAPTITVVKPTFVTTQDASKAGDEKQVRLGDITGGNNFLMPTQVTNNVQPSDVTVVDKTKTVIVGQSVWKWVVGGAILAAAIGLGAGIADHYDAFDTTNTTIHR